MSTRMRVVLSSPNDHFSGPYAVKQLAAIAAQRGFGFMDPNWRKISKRERLERMAQFLAPNWTLQLFQEPRGTRQSRSLYWRAREQKPKKKVEDYRAIRDAAQQAIEGMAVQAARPQLGVAQAVGHFMGGPNQAQVRPPRMRRPVLFGEENF